MRKLALLFAAAAVFLLIFFVTRNSSRALAASDTTDHILIHKSAHTMTLYNGARELKTYRVALGRGPGNAKRHEGDHETPEGHYIIDARRPRSRFHLALHVSYPNATDRAQATTLGKDPGGDIMIHGLPAVLGWIGGLHRTLDWTNGCIAVTNNEMDELWKAVPNGTPVDIQH